MDRNHHSIGGADKLDVAALEKSARRAEKVLVERFEQVISY